MVKVHARNTTELHTILHRLRAAAGNVNTVTSIVLHTIKENSPIVVHSVELEKETKRCASIQPRKTGPASMTAPTSARSSSTTGRPAPSPGSLVSSAA
ncbi:MAG: hypothetical protein KIT87_15675 [Anaerolineae bacterium]|nr:hypothetical protein [Anaerolineae bacterium]